MIFFDNCCSKFWSSRCLSFRWLFGRCFWRPHFLLVSLLFLSSTAFGMQVTLNLKSVTIETAFAEIKKQSGYGFWYEKKDLEGLSKIALELKNANLVTALEACLKGQPLTYQIFDKTVVVKRKGIASPIAVPVKKPLQEKIKGKVVDAQTKEPLAGVLIKVKLPEMSVVTDDKGMFELTLPTGTYDLVVQYLGYGIQKMDVSVPLAQELVVSLVSGEEALNAVEVVSTGYQTLPKERATGSFVLVDNALLNRSVGTNILDRLEGVTSSLSFNTNNSGGVGFNSSSLSIRGRSTILGDAEPLIVLDNFAYTGDLSAINPNDVETITILKDAAAASIWGTKAGNGVIVITTKSGRFNQKTNVSFNANTTIAEKPQLDKQRQLTSSEYLEVERYLFEQGKFNAAINNGYGALSPAVEIMLAHRQGKIDAATRDQSLERLSLVDARGQQLHYLYRKPIAQQYQLNISGGGNEQKFFLSGSFDRNLETATTDKYNRLSINANHTLQWFGGKLSLNSSLQLIKDDTEGGRAVSNPRYPYEQIADENGQALAVTDGVLRAEYLSLQEAKGLLDWRYRPLDENVPRNFMNSLSLRVNNTLSYKLNSFFKLAASHSFRRGMVDNSQSFDQNSYYTRNQINSLSTVNAATGIVTRPIPIGDILMENSSEYVNNFGRLQLHFDKEFSNRHVISGIAGAEVSQRTGEGARYTLYGYDPETGISANQFMDFGKDYSLYYNGAPQRIPSGMRNSGITDRYVSYFTNFSYTYLSKYSLSASGRRDESNLFGVKANQKGVPLWSVGGAWEISKEKFYRFTALPYLRMRLTYGLSGNVDKSTTAFLTASPSSAANRWNAAQASITNPPNPSLSWEKVRNYNLGIDFSTQKKRLTGTIEYFVKQGYDLIGTSPIAPQTGIVQFRGNSASLTTKGFDIVLNTLNLTGKLKWNTTLLFNQVNDVVTEFKTAPASNYDIVYGTYNTPLVGYPYNSLFSFKWAGLDQTGAPQSYLNGVLSNDYTGIRNSTDRANLTFEGSRSPTTFGSILNNFSYGGFNVSFNLVYKFNYVLRRSSLDNVTLYNGGYLMPDYSSRWTKAGDELRTDVPALIYPANVARQSVYSLSEVLTYKGDHIRLNDIRLGYDFNKKAANSLGFKSIGIFTYMRNVAILWKANKYNIDPDSPILPQGKQFAFGANFNF